MTTPTLTEIIETSLLAERTADVSDQASRVEEEEAMHRRIAHDRKMKPEQDPTLPREKDKDTLPLGQQAGPFLSEDCDECGLEIGLDRIAVAIKNRHCFACQSLKERMNGYRR